MMKTSFEIEITASTLEEASAKASDAVSTFLNIPKDDVLNHTDVELKVTSKNDSDFTVTVFANVKRGVTKN
jgi:hypothetical protein